MISKLKMNLLCSTELYLPNYDDLVYEFQFICKNEFITFFTKNLQNWYLYPIVYFKLTKNKHVIFETKAGQKSKFV